MLYDRGSHYYGNGDPFSCNYDEFLVNLATNILSCCSKKKVGEKKVGEKKVGEKKVVAKKSPSKPKASTKPDTKVYKSAKFVKDSDDSSEEEEEEEEEAETKPPPQPLATGWFGVEEVNLYCPNVSLVQRFHCNLWIDMFVERLFSSRRL